MQLNKIVVKLDEDTTLSVYSDIPSDVLILDESKDGNVKLNGRSYEASFKSILNPNGNNASKIYSEAKLKALNDEISLIQEQINDTDRRIEKIKGEKNSNIKKLVAMKNELRQLKQFYTIDKQEAEANIKS